MVKNTYFNEGNLATLESTYGVFPEHGRARLCPWPADAEAHRVVRCGLPFRAPPAAPE